MVRIIELKDEKRQILRAPKRERKWQKRLKNLKKRLTELQKLPQTSERPKKKRQEAVEQKQKRKGLDHEKSIPAPDFTGVQKVWKRTDNGEISHMQGTFLGMRMMKIGQSWCLASQVCTKE